MSEALSIIEAKHKELSELVQKKSDYLTQTNVAIKQLRAERKKAIGEIQEMNGAIIAYSSSINLIKGPQPAEAVVESVEPAVSEPVVVEGVVETAADTVTY